MPTLTGRLRGIELVTLTEDQLHAIGLETNRRKGSRDNIVRWNDRLKDALDAALALRQTIWDKNKTPIPLNAKDRLVFVAAHGGRLAKSSFDTAWQRLVHKAMDAKVITQEERFGLHDLKRRGITDTPGTRDVKKEASGHKTDSQLDVDDLSLPVVEPAAE